MTRYPIGSCPLFLVTKNNPKGNCAIAMFEDIKCTRRVAYFQCEDSSLLYRLFKDKLINCPCYLKAKQHINKFSKYGRYITFLLALSLMKAT